MKHMTAQLPSINEIYERLSERTKLRTSIENIEDVTDVLGTLLAAYEQEPVAVMDDAAETLQKICNVFRIGILAQTQSTILANVENVVRFADQLHAIEREFFMVPGEPDEDYPDDEPADVCLVNCWGATTEQYVEQFREALLRITHPAPSIPAAVPEDVLSLFLRAKALMYQSGGTPIENSLNPIDAWLYDAESAAMLQGQKL